MEYSLDHQHLYLQNRLVDPNIAQLFGIGVYNDRCLFTVTDSYGSFIGYVKRVLHDQSHAIRYDFSEVKKSQYLFNYARARQLKRKAVIVVEGFIDAVKIHQAGYPSVISLMGSIMSDRQEALLLRYWEHVIFMMDGDKAGRQAQKELIARLGPKVTGQVHGINLSENEQPDSMTPDRVVAVLSGAR